MRVALGASLTACGAGLMVYGTYLMKTKTYWRNDYVYWEDGSEHLVSSKGKKAGPLWLWSLAGAVPSGYGLTVRF